MNVKREKSNTNLLIIESFRLPVSATSLSKYIDITVKKWKKLGFTRFDVRYQPQFPGDPPDIELIGYTDQFKGDIDA